MSSTQAIVEKAEISSRSIPDLLHRLGSQKASGLLEFHGPRFKRSITLREGRIVTVASNDRDDRFCRVLLTDAALPLQALSDALEVSLLSSRRLGEVLVERGSLTEAQVRRWLKVQFRQIAEQIFAMPDGRYAFYPREVRPSEIALDCTCDELIVSTARTQRYWARIAEFVGGLNAAFIASSLHAQIAAGAGLNPEEHHLVELTLSEKTLGELCEASEMTDYETARTVWVLAILGILHPA